MSPSAHGASRWIKPEIYPLFAAMGTALGLCVFVMARNLVSNPDVRINKAHRTAGYLENHKEGEQYHDNFLRKYVEERQPHIFTSLNKGFTAPK